MIDFKDRMKIEKFFRLLSLGANEESCELLNDLEDIVFVGAEYAKGMREGILKDDWSSVGERFASGKFVHESGYFLLIGPYSRRRDGFRETMLSGLHGVVTLDIDIQHVRPSILDVFGSTGEEFAQVLGFRLFTSFGLIGGEDGEAFLVPTSWRFPDALEGPALNDLTEQTVRLRQAVNGIRRLFDKSTLEVLLPLVLDPITSASIRNLEYQYHDAGHSTGIGIKQKMKRGWFRSPRNCGIEEWRSDGVMFYLGSKTLNKHEYCQLIAANLILRFGIDSQRKGGVERDPDVFCTALLIDDLLSANGIYVDEDGKIGLNINSSEDIPNLVDAMVQRTMSYTRKEYSENAALEAIYEPLKASKKSISMLNNVVRRNNHEMSFMA